MSDGLEALKGILFSFGTRDSKEEKPIYARG
jgi:hypothetical protein